MKILTVSDRVEPLLYHNFAPGRFKGVELILSCGDLPPEYLTFLAWAFKVPLYFVRGNHDLRFISKQPDGCTSLDGRILRFQGLNFLGLDGSRWYNGGPYQYTEAQMRGRIRGLRRKIRRRGGIDIVISHAPPRHIHDAEDPCHKGFHSYNRLIDRYSPTYFIHGHIHSFFADPSERIMVVNNTKVINTYGYHLFETEDEKDAQ